MKAGRREFLKLSVLAAAGGPIGRAMGAGRSCEIARECPAAAVRVRCFDGGWQMHAFSNRSIDIMLSTLFVSPTGRLVMIDGGWALDGDFLLPTLKRLGGVVDTWFITHAHGDHYMALDSILRKPRCGGLKVGRIVLNFPPMDFIASTEKSCVPHVNGFLANVRLSGIAVQKPAAGQTFDFGEGLTFECLNGYDLSMRRDAINNSSICFRVVNGGKSILVTGDVGAEMGDKLLKALPHEKLKSDICFMAHHGQAGAKRDFYAAVRPEICLWPTPQWLWDNDLGGENGPGSGPFLTNYTKCWMQELGVRRQYLLTKDIVFA